MAAPSRPNVYPNALPGGWEFRGDPGNLTQEEYERVADRLRFRAHVKRFNMNNADEVKAYEDVLTQILNHQVARVAGPFRCGPDMALIHLEWAEVYGEPLPHGRRGGVLPGQG